MYEYPIFITVDFFNKYTVNKLDIEGIQESNSLIEVQTFSQKDIFLSLCLS